MIELPLRIESVANKREHWSVRGRRTKQHRLAALAVPVHPLLVRLGNDTGRARAAIEGQGVRWGPRTDEELIQVASYVIAKRGSVPPSPKPVEAGRDTKCR